MVAGHGEVNTLDGDREMSENGTRTAMRAADDRGADERVARTKGEEEAISCRLGRLIDYVENAENDLDEESQKTLSELIVAMSHIETSGNAYLTGAAEVAVRALCAKPPKLKLARELTKSTRKRVRFYGWLGSPSTAVAFGLSLFFYLLAPFSLLIVDQMRHIDFEELLGTSLGMLLLVGLAGALGSIVSVLIRIQNHSFNPKVWEPGTFVFTGLFKPIVGMAFAVFVFAIFNSGIVPVDIMGPDNGPKENLFFLAVAFVAGFSERFAKDIAKETEVRYGDPGEYGQSRSRDGSGDVRGQV
jgi:hypothetical protein